MCLNKEKHLKAESADHSTVDVYSVLKLTQLLHSIEKDDLTSSDKENVDCPNLRRVSVSVSLM